MTDLGLFPCQPHILAYLTQNALTLFYFIQFRFVIELANKVSDIWWDEQKFSLWEWPKGEQEHTADNLTTGWVVCRGPADTRYKAENADCQRSPDRHSTDWDADSWAPNGVRYR